MLATFLWATVFCVPFAVALIYSAGLADLMFWIRCAWSFFLIAVGFLLLSSIFCSTKRLLYGVTQYQISNTPVLCLPKTYHAFPWATAFPLFDAFSSRILHLLSRGLIMTVFNPGVHKINACLSKTATAVLTGIIAILLLLFPCLSVCI